MDLKQLKYFVTIVEEKNITKAAKKLHIAQPHLSNQLKLIENELGVNLIERSTRKMQITEAGQLLMDRSKQILELMETTTKELKDFNEGVQGTLSIGTIASAGDTLLPERIHKFNNKYPEISFEIHENSSDQIYELLKDGFIEIGIIRTPFNTDIFESIYLTNEPMVAAFCEDFSWSISEKTINIIELEDKPLLVHRRYEKMILEACNQEGFEPRILSKIEDTRSILLWANTGMGVAIVPKDWAQLVPDLTLRYKELNAPSLKTRTAIIWVKNRYMSSMAKHFLNTFK